MKTYKTHGGEVSDTTQPMVNPEAYWKARSERAEARVEELERKLRLYETASSYPRYE